MKILPCCRTESWKFIHWSTTHLLRKNNLGVFEEEIRINSRTVSTSPISDVFEPIKSPNSVSQSNGSFKHKADMIPSDVKSWTSIILSTAKMGANDKALAYFSHMRRAGIEPNKITFSISLGVCCKSRSVDFGMSLHCLILKRGLLREVFLASGLVTMYSKFDYIEDARQVFDEILVRDSVTWNSMISAYSQNALYEEAIGTFSLLFSNTTDWKRLVNGFTFATIFKACAGLGYAKIGKSVHCFAIKFGCDSDVFVAGSTVDMYSKCSSLDIAKRVFDRLEKQDLVAWNAMITGYSQNDYSWEVIELFQQLQFEGFSPNETTFACILKASTLIDGFTGEFFHAKALKLGFSSDVFVGTSLIDMYSKHSQMKDAERVFGDLATRNMASFNALITGYSLSGHYKQTLITYTILLSENLRPDSFTFTGIFSSCAAIGALEEGLQVHSHSIMFGLDSHVTVGNSLVSFYAKCGLMDSASQSFISITKPNSVSWAGIISGFAQNGKDQTALEYFCKMYNLSGKPDEFSFTSVLKALAFGAAIDQGRIIHALVTKEGLESTVFIGSALLDMYSKCGIVEDAYKVFSAISEKNIVSWNSMITGYAQNGFADKSLSLFSEMIDLNVIPTSITFTGVLLACSNAGLVEEGKLHYNSMVSDYQISPSVEHCTCMVDLLGRAGNLNDAENFILDSPFPSEFGLWRSLLAACGVHRNTDVAIRAAEQCLRLEPKDPSAYVMLSNIYASKQLWSEVSRMRDLMKEMHIEKEPGRSWVGESVLAAIS